MSNTSHVVCFQPPEPCCGSGGAASSAVPVGQVTGPGALAGTITIAGSQITGTIPASALPPMDCKQTIACLTPGSVPTTALAPGPLPSGVTVPASALPPTTVSNTIAGSGAARTVSTTVNGVTGAAVGIPDLDVYPVSTAFSPTTGILTTTLNNGTILTANIGIASVDQFLDTAVYVTATATLKLTMSNGTVKNIPLSDLVKVTTSGQAIVGDGTTITPVALVIDPASTPNVVSQSAAGLLITLPKNVTPWDCKQTIACLTPGSIPATALAPGPLPSGVTVPASALPPTTVSNTIAGSGAARTVSTTVNGVTGPAVGIPDLDGQTLSISGQTLTISSGNSVTLPSATATSTTHTSAWVQATGLTDTVNGVATTITIPSGVITQVIGYNASGNPVYQNVSGPIVDVHQLTGGDFPNFSTFNGKTYPAALWSPSVIGETWQFQGSAQLQRHQSQWSVNGAGNWTIQFDLAGNTNINEQWPSIQVAFTQAAVSRFGGI